MVDSELQLGESHQTFIFAVWDIMDYLFEVIGIDDPTENVSDILSIFDYAVNSYSPMNELMWEVE